MPRIHVLDPAEADGRAKELLDTVRAKFGATPNSMKAMAGSAAARGRKPPAPGGKPTGRGWWR